MLVHLPDPAATRVESVEETPDAVLVRLTKRPLLFHSEGSPRLQSWGGIRPPLVERVHALILLSPMKALCQQSPGY